MHWGLIDVSGALMGRYLACFVLLATVAWGTVARAQFEDVEDELQSYPDLASKIRVVRFGIIGGRITGVSSHFSTNISSATTDPLTGDSERLTVDITSGLPAMHYELSTKTEELSVDVADGDKLLIRRTKKGDSTVVSLLFQQLPGEALKLTVGDGEAQRTTPADSIWHLLIAEPTLCGKRLVPLLEMLRRDWHLTATGIALEETLFRRANSSFKPDRKQWQQWVDDLGSDKFAVRERAERQLSPPAVTLPFLESLDQKARRRAALPTARSPGHFDRRSRRHFGAGRDFFGG